MNGDATRRELIGGGFFNFNESSEYFLLHLTRNIFNTKRWPVNGYRDLELDRGAIMWAYCEIAEEI